MATDEFKGLDPALLAEFCGCEPEEVEEICGNVAFLMFSMLDAIKLNQIALSAFVCCAPERVPSLEGGNMRSIVLAAALICGITGIARADHCASGKFIQSDDGVRREARSSRASYDVEAGVRFGVIPLASWGLLQRRGLILLE